MRQLLPLVFLATPLLLPASGGGERVRSASWIIPVLEMGVHPEDDEDMWAEVVVENRGRSEATVVWVARHGDGRMHPSTEDGVVIAPGESHTFKATPVQPGPMEYGWARITAFSRTRPRMRVTAWAYGLDGDHLTRYERSVSRPSDMDRSFLKAWTNSEKGEKIYAINNTAEETPIEVCYGAATITAVEGVISRRKTMLCDDKEEYPVPAGGARAVRITRPGQVFATFSTGIEGDLILAGTVRVEGDTSMFDVESSFAADEPD